MNSGDAYVTHYVSLTKNAEKRMVTMTPVDKQEIAIEPSFYVVARQQWPDVD